MKVTLQKHELLSKMWMLPKPQFDALLSTLASSNEVTIESDNELKQHCNVGADRATGQYIAIIPLKGILFRSAYLENGKPIGADATLAQLEASYADPKCKGIVLKTDCPGGAEDASFLLADAVARRNKPVAAFVDFGMCMSGGMMIVSACDLVVASSDTCRLGGIGAYTTYTDYSRALEAQGIKTEQLYAPQSFLKNYDMREAAKGNYKPLVEYVTKRAEEFQLLVYYNRRGRWNEIELTKDVFAGAEVSGYEAYSAGLIDAIGKLEEVIQWINQVTNNQN